RLRRHADRAAAFDRPAGADQPRTGRQIAAGKGRIQGRHAVDGLAVGRGAAREKGSAGARRLERDDHFLGVRGHPESGVDGVPERQLRQGAVRLAVRRRVGAAARPVRAGDRSGEAEGDCGSGASALDAVTDPCLPRAVVSAVGRSQEHRRYHRRAGSGVLEHDQVRRVSGVSRPRAGARRCAGPQPMFAFIGRRLLATIPVMAVVAVFVFMMLRLASGDPAAIIAGNAATAQDIVDIRQKLGLDQPIVTQFFIWLGHVVTGDFGESFFYKKQVAEIIADRAGPTLALAACTLAISVLVAVPLGVIAAYRCGTWLDRVVMGFSVLGFSVPVFVIGYALIYLFAIKLSWLPVQGYQPLADGIGGFFARLILPSVTLSVIYIALIARITRTSVLEVLGEDYIRTARAKGLSSRVVLMRHALRNAAVPIVTVIGIGVALLIGGVVVTESVFSIPGLGRLTVDAVLARDYPTVQAVILLFSLAYVLINLLVDVAYTLLDPRIRY